MVPPVGGGVSLGSMPSGGLRRVDARAHEWMYQLLWGKLVHKLVQKLVHACAAAAAAISESHHGFRFEQRQGQRCCTGCRQSKRISEAKIRAWHS